MCIYILSIKYLTKYGHDLHTVQRYLMDQTYTSSAHTIRTQGTPKRVSASKAQFFPAAGISFCRSISLWFSGLSVAGADLAMRGRANESPVDSYHEPEAPSPAAFNAPQGVNPR